MPSRRSPAENTVITAGARIASHGSRLATAVRKRDEITPIIDAARLDVARAIAAAAPLLTAEQREMLRPILAGTIPASDSSDAAA